MDFDLDLHFWQMTTILFYYIF